jgi:large subunit ribosomal protein L24
MKIRKNDTVIVTTGKDSGRQGIVEKVSLSQGTVLVSGINQYKRHIKKRSKDQPGEIVTLSRPLDVSKVALICPKCKQPTRVGFMVKKDKKIRVCRKCNLEI